MTPMNQLMLYNAATQTALQTARHESEQQESVARMSQSECKYSVHITYDTFQCMNESEYQAYKTPSTENNASVGETVIVFSCVTILVLIVVYFIKRKENNRNSFNIWNMNSKNK